MLLRDLTRDPTAQGVCDVGHGSPGRVRLGGTQAERQSLPMTDHFSMAWGARPPTSVTARSPPLRASSPDQGQGGWALTEVRAPFSSPLRPRTSWMSVHKEECGGGRQSQLPLECSMSCLFVERRSLQPRPPRTSSPLSVGGGHHVLNLKWTLVVRQPWL